MSGFIGLQVRAEEKLEEYAQKNRLDKEALRIALILAALPDPKDETLALGLPMTIHQMARAFTELRA